MSSKRNRSFFQIENLEPRNLLTGDFAQLFGGILIAPEPVELNEPFGGIWLEDRFELYGRHNNVEPTIHHAPAIQVFHGETGAREPVTLMAIRNPSGDEDRYQGTVFDAGPAHTKCVVL